ncbi:STAS domain-containing protein [Rhodoferax aquaticus]|uniref:STAS domain-containing protein n=1 Tax=Rhodoferax aquaticus TaxID=2527691 RepID=A0A515ELH4_9BURK|nr:STAS domain-containing protein [Rhodoferax aquaticus]QDL53512.1 STAS domain-containing protein [Rhodoferax aquaticus]
MATQNDRLSLLSKVALFVRNPTKDWAELDRPAPNAESGYDKQALKAMIERKRQNDFVRRREFDHLRKLRRRESSEVGGLARPSIFQNSMATDPDGRAVTLKKIDEIEAQMSKQWWKGKAEPVAEAASTLPSPKEPAAVAPVVSGQTSSGSFQSTVPGEPLRRATEFTETEMGPGMQPTSLHVAMFKRAQAMAPTVPAGFGEKADAAEIGFSTSKLFAMEGQDLATDPELEEAAIRFANGDDLGAEEGLLTALRGDALLPEVALSWAVALLDLYRATNNRDGFDHALDEFALRFEGLSPIWTSFSEPAPQRSDPGVSLASAPTVYQPFGSEAANVLWRSPSELTVDSMEQLRSLLAANATPWNLRWTGLLHIQPEAVPLLGGLLGSLCDEPVSLGFLGEEDLVACLRDMTPSNDRTVPPQWWMVRLNALRVMGLHDEFELAALDYCVTFEVSPPAWVPARCVIEDLDSQQYPVSGGSAWDSSARKASSSGFASTAVLPITPILELRGAVLGDGAKALTEDETPIAGKAIHIGCHHLVRVDFSAAGSLLNWVASKEALGYQIQFVGVHRLVAAFFTVIGINEHAKVLTRSI